VIRRYGAAFLAGAGARLTPGQRKSLAAMGVCRTAAMGTHLQACSHCGAEVVLYNSCGDRHCPGCQGGRRAAWFEKQQQDLLPVEYFHVVFTVPDTLNGLALAHPAEFYNLLFRAARETLVEAAQTSRYLGGQTGGVMVLHTWGQNLSLHPHLHVIVPGGAISPDGQAWRCCPRGFFLPVRVLSRLFRGKLLAYLLEAHDAGQLPMSGGQARLADPQQFRRFLSPLQRTEWVVYAKPPITGQPETILGYLARYIHRVAISNQRLVSIEHGSVTFQYKDYARGNRWQPMTLPAEEFLRRLSMHLLPRGFVRVRTFGFLANCHRQEKLGLIRQLLEVPPPVAGSADAEGKPTPQAARCPHCGQAALYTVRRTPRPTVRELIARTYGPQPFDTS
jgi:hypothetical protein